MVIIIITGRSGGEPQPGPSQQLRYNFRKKSERTYVKNVAIDKTYQVKVDEEHHRQRLEDIRDGLHRMFERVLEEARCDSVGNDLSGFVIQHDALHDPIIIPLQPWDQLNADVVLGTVGKVLDSNQNLTVDESMDISFGTVELPKGSGGTNHANRRITKIKGKSNSLDLKTISGNHRKQRSTLYGQSKWGQLGQI